MSQNSIKCKTMLKSKLMIFKILKIQFTARKVLNRVKTNSQFFNLKKLKVKKCLKALTALRTNRWKAKMSRANNPTKKFRFQQSNNMKISFYHRMIIKILNKSNLMSKK